MVGATVTVSDGQSKTGTVWASDVPVQHNSPDTTKLPTNVEVTKTNIKGPAVVKVKVDSMGSRFVTSSSNYLVVFSVY